MRKILVLLATLGTFAMLAAPAAADDHRPHPTSSHGLGIFVWPAPQTVHHHYHRTWHLRPQPVYRFAHPGGQGGTTGIARSRATSTAGTTDIPSGATATTSGVMTAAATTGAMATGSGVTAPGAITRGTTGAITDRWRVTMSAGEGLSRRGFAA